VGNNGEILREIVWEINGGTEFLSLKWAVFLVNVVLILIIVIHGI
jgi:hypothetical protein